MPDYKTSFVLLTTIIMSIAFGTAANAQSFIEKSLVAKSRLHNPLWKQHDPASSTKIDHSIWNLFLKTYVSTDQKGVNRVNYSGVSGEDKTNLSTYLTSLQNVDVTTLNRSEQFAFWLNLYNANVVSIVLANYPIASILDVKSNPLDLKGPFNDTVARVNGQSLTLDTIESGIVRPIWRDPRLHYAFNCGAVGCPNLMKVAYQSDVLDTQLDTAAVSYVNDPRGINVKDSQTILSKIYFWYSADFGDDVEALSAHLTQYASAETRKRIEMARGRYRYSYDWSLNDAR